MIPLEKADAARRDWDDRLREERLRTKRLNCEHDYEVQDDKGWRCKLCEHET